MASDEPVTALLLPFMEKLSPGTAFTFSLLPVNVFPLLPGPNTMVLEEPAMGVLAPEIIFAVIPLPRVTCCRCYSVHLPEHR